MGTLYCIKSQDQGDSIQVTRLEKWVLLLARRFLFPDKLKLKKRQWQCHLSRCHAVSTHAITVFSPVSEIRQFPSFNF